MPSITTMSTSFHPFLLPHLSHCLRDAALIPWRARALPSWTSLMTRDLACTTLLLHHATASTWRQVCPSWIAGGLSRSMQKLMCCVCVSPGSASSTAAGSSTRPLAEVWSTGRSETWCFSYGYPFLIEAQREEVRPGCFLLKRWHFDQPCRYHASWRG